MKETVAITINVDPSIRQQLKIIAAQQAKSLRDLLLPELERLIQNARSSALCESNPPCSVGPSLQLGPRLAKPRPA